MYLAPRPDGLAFGAAVIIAEDLTDLYKWRRERLQWDRVVAQLKQQVRYSEELVRLSGFAKSVAPQVVGSVPSVLDPTACALSLKKREQAQQEGRTAFGLEKTGRATARSDQRVETSYRLFDQTEKRDEQRYTAFAEQAALLSRYDEAIAQLRVVEQKELKLQQSLLERLRSAQTLAEMAAIQSSLTASHQRCELATHKAEQARDESARFESQRRLEQERRHEADREWTDTLVEKLKQRALTSLHAQKGENS